MVAVEMPSWRTPAEAGAGVWLLPCPNPSLRSTPSGLWWMPVRWLWPARRNPRLQDGRAPPQGRRCRHRQGLCLGAAGRGAGCGRSHYPHRCGEGGCQLWEARSAVAGSPDSGGGPQVRGRGPVRPRFHAAQGPAAVKFAESSPAAPPSSRCWKGQGRHRRPYRYCRVAVMTAAPPY